MSFNGFCSYTLDFLIENRLNNSKLWFDEHKTEYNDFVLAPFKELVCVLSGHLLEIDPLLEVTPATNKTISRIYRDTRFSKDKSLFRDNMWLVFMRPHVRARGKSWPEYPAFYFELYPSSYRYGVGYYMASRETMQLYREHIGKNSPAFLKAIASYENQHIFKLMGDKYKKTLAPNQPDHIKDWYDRKNIYFEHVSTNMEQLFSKDLVSELLNGYNILQPIYEFLCNT